MKRFMIPLALAGALIFNTGMAQQAQASDETVGTIIGAVGGGLLGSAMGKGKGRLVATAAGTVIGAVIGHEIAHDTYDNDPYKRPRVHAKNRDYRDYDDYDRPRTRVVYKRVPVKVHKHPKHKKWNRVARYDGDVLICNKNGKRCHWYD